MKIKLWTIQHIEAYHCLKETGILCANEEYLFCQDDLRFAYDWMVEQMRIKIGPPPVGVGYPIWAWYQWEGERKRRDLRFSGYAKRGTPMVQIEFEVEDRCILLSDFDGWHFVLNHSYLADNEEDFDSFYASKAENAQDQIRASWDKIFDLERYVPDWDCPKDEMSVQATLWQVHISQVKKVEFFNAK